MDHIISKYLEPGSMSIACFGGCLGNSHHLQFIWLSHSSLRCLPIIEGQNRSAPPPFDEVKVSRNLHPLLEARQS